MERRFQGLKEFAEVLPFRLSLCPGENQVSVCFGPMKVFCSSHLGFVSHGMAWCLQGRSGVGWACAMIGGDRLVLAQKWRYLRGTTWECVKRVSVVGVLWGSLKPLRVCRDHDRVRAVKSLGFCSRRCRSLTMIEASRSGGELNLGLMMLGPGWMLIPSECLARVSG